LTRESWADKRNPQIGVFGERSALAGHSQKTRPPRRVLLL
jgi:hypothetical protein